MKIWSDCLDGGEEQEEDVQVGRVFRYPRLVADRL